MDTICKSLQHEKPKIRNASVLKFMEWYALIIYTLLYQGDIIFNKIRFFLILKRFIQLCDILELFLFIKWSYLKCFLIEMATFDVKVVVSNAINAFKSKMAQIKNVNLIILILFIEPKLKGAHFYLFLQEMQESLMITYFLSNFWNKTLNFVPNTLLNLFV